MITFFLCLALLIVGFFTYGKLVERVFHIDDRQTPALAHPDGVDYVPMKTWRIFLIQLLQFIIQSLLDNMYLLLKFTLLLHKLT